MYLAIVLAKKNNEVETETDIDRVPWCKRYE